MNPKITTADSRLPDSATGAMPASGERLSTQERRRLLDTLLRNRAASGGAQSRIPKLPRTEGVNVFAASFAQERLWFFTQLETNSPFYNQTLGLRARGRLNEAVLKESLSLIAKRHETMRTTFVVEDQRLVQIVSPDCSAHLDVIDLTTLPSGEREGARQEIVSAETNRPFDLAQGPVLRSTLVRLGEEESFLMFSAHHIVTDYWGLSVFLTELTAIYSSLSEGLEPAQAEPPIQYADFAMWHRDWMRSGVYEKQLAYWKKQLEGAETLRFPTDFARPPIQAFRGAIFRWPLGAELASKVRAFSDANGVTLYMTLLTAFKLLLQRYSGQQEVIVGTPIANRSLLELERIIGFFSNTLVLRTELGCDISFRSALDKVKEVCLAAYTHQDLPFEKLVEELQPERDLRRNPLFQVMFRVQTALLSSLELKGLSLSQVWDDDVEPGARFDLELAIRDDKEDFIATLEYNTDLFMPATIERISRHYRYLLTAALSDPNRPVSMLAMVGEDERAQLLNEWNETGFDYGEPLFPHEMFQRQARQHPYALALEFEDRQMSYAELNEKANRLAHYLRRQGVGPESVVGLYLERSLEMVIALLAVMKAGGAYLPIEGSSPAERVAYMLEDAGATVVLSQEGLRQAIAGASAKVVSVDGLSDELRTESREDPAVALDAENLAYVIYTSGSTGRPKGAMNTYGAISNRLLWMQQTYQLDSTDRVLQKTPFSFDVSVWEFFWPLMTGATLVIVPPGGHRDSQYLARLIAEKQITTVHFVPSMLAVFLQEPEAVDCKNLRRVICSGEALPKELSARCLSRLPADLHNLYGPTEAAIDVTSWHCQPEDRRPAVPIGKPIANTQMYVVDEDFNLLPIGMAGELCIGGVGLARGYLNRPGLTADKFVADPFSIRTGARMYRTGDLARWATDGNLEFLGRRDSQVKIRGFRIEPGEIEATLRQHPAVEQAVAATYPDERGDHRIVAYVVPDEAELGAKNGLQSEQVNQWQTVWNETYEPGSHIADPTFNIAGWKSSYSHQLLSDEEMREWLSRTVDRILALQPRRAIEIGCGTGMLLFRIAPHCEEYWASDFSQEALNYVQKHAESLSDRLPIANLLCREASVFDGLDENSFDTIILNSVVQYFPAIEYLTQVLEGAIRIGSPGGRIFIGDVRSLPLLEAMHASVLLSQADDEFDAGRFVQRWRSAIKQEEELVISQAYFAMLKRQFPKISYVEMKPKRGWHENEMNRFRYDVVIHLGTRPDIITPSRTIEWSKETLDLSGITQMLCEHQPDSLVITGVPNSRLHSDVAAVRVLRTIDGIQTVGELRRVINGSDRKGIHPEELWSLGDQLPYQVDLSWHAARSDGSFDVAFLSRKRNGDFLGKDVSIEWPSPSFDGRPSFDLANNPLRQKSVGGLGPELRRFVEQKLPEYMVPSSFVLLDALPLNANGKLDRKALKPPETQATATTKYVAPRNPLEETVCGIWEYILRLDRVGVEHNFFELGGHSLLATQVISRIRTLLSVKLPLQAIFNHPTVSKLASQIELARRQQKQSMEPPLVRLEHKEPAPLSYAQQRLWFIDRLEPGSAYNMPGAVRLRGELDVAALRRSLSEIVGRHEVLRTSFPQRDGQPFQHIHPPSELDLTFIDLSDKPVEQAEASALTLSQWEAKRCFDLSTGPLMRAMLLKVAEADHVLVVTMHHIVSDGWSVGILIREFMQLYRAYSSGRESGLEELPLQYADFAVWQRECLKGDVLKEQMKYWKGQLEGVSALGMPTDRPRSAMASHRGESVKFSWGEELTGQMKALARREGATLFMVVLAGFQVLLSRYSRQEDVAIGTDVANRNRSEIEGLIGFFVNQLVLRCRLDPQQSFRRLVSEVREVTLGAYEHQDLPFEKLVAELALERDMSRAPLSQVKLTLQNTEQPNLNLDGLQVDEFDVENGIVKVDLQLMLHEVEGRLEGALYYATDLYESATAQRILGHLEVLLKSIAANPDRAICELPLMSEAERDQLLKRWNNTETAYREALFVHQMFQRRAELNPDAVALIFDDRQMSYGDLNRKANRLAHFLRREGVGPESIVAVYLDRSMELVVALIAVLKAGAAYVPIDTGYPAERAAYMLKDAAAKVVITREEMRETVDGLGLEVVSVDRDREEIDEQSEEEPGMEVSGENVAYVIYTSGSTGKPKGVCVTHNDLICLFKATERWFNFDHNDVWTLFHSYAFDFSVWEMWGALLYGGSLVVVPYWISRSPDKFLELIKRERVTVLNQTPSAFRQLIRADGASDEGDLSLRLVIFGGEALGLSSLRPWFERHPEDLIRLVNMYGITETTVHVTYRPIKSADVFEAHGSVIGGPIPHLQVYLLNDYLDPVPIGFPGQIYVGGAGLARGYLNRPGLTADRFIPNPFSNEPGARLYKSGDLARFLPGGDFEYLRRTDHQVKIRGFRIELGEIEAALVQHPGVREAVVLALDDTPSQKRLVGYIVAKDKELATAGNLRKFLQKSLPETLIPAAFVLMESFPLTSNGKLDRASLPAPSMSRPGFHEPFVPPQNEEEELLAKIWGEVIGVDQVGSHDNFFALGGDSMRSIQVLYRAEQQGLRFTFQQLFQHQTIHELVESIKSQDEQADSPLRAKPFPFGTLTPDDLKKLPPNVEDAYPLASLQAGMIFHTELNDNATAYHDVFSYHLRSPFSECDFRRAAEEIIARHPVLRTSFDLVSFSRPLQIVHADSNLSLEIFDLRGMAETQQEAHIREWVDRETHRGFDWRQAPLLRFYIHRRSDKTFQLTVSFHHSILDGWSLATMLTELFQRYFRLLGKNIESPLPPPKSSYSDFIVLEQEAIESERARRYWEEKLDASTVCRLPRLRPQPGDSPSEKGRVQVLDVPISDEVSKGLPGVAQRAGLPLKSICLAVHLKVLSLLTGQSDILTGLVSNGRLEEEDGDRVLGLFLNTVPLRQRLNGGTWLQLAEEVFAAERELLPFRRYPLAHLSKASELFEVAFNYTHFHVYQGLERFDELQLLGNVAYEETNFTLMVNFVHSILSSQVQLSLNYNASALSEEEINTIGKYYARGLEAMVAESTGRYELTSLLSGQERRRLLIGWNDTQVEYRLGRCLHNWVEDQVERTPEATALIFGHQSLNYRELNARANQLAHHLKNIGVSAGGLVGICVERSIEMVVGLLGILKAGAGYLPLDPAYPKDRLAYILGDAKPSALLTQQDLAETLVGAGIHVIALDAGWDAFTVNDDENPNVKVQPDDVAYAIYTSGSTGRPKGVLISHRGICNRLLWMQDIYQLGSTDSILQKTPFVFDVSVWEFFWPLMTGARLVIARPEGHKDSKYLINLIVEQQITTLHFVPPMLQVFLEEEGIERCKSLKQVICSGEALSHELQERFHARLDAELHNLYGPTEASVDVTSWRCERNSRQRSVPIGFPIANTQIYILDQHLQLLPAEVAGQLHIAGTGLAHGYLNRADLTAQAFIPNPYSEKPGDRLYRTGDLARHLPDGSIEYLGRIDNQVKIRGFRVEFGEIENILLEHGSVREAVVVAHEDGREVKRLVACVVPDREAPPSIDDLEGFLKQRLPEYMVPSAFVLLDAIPLSSNGKVSRKSLLALDALGLAQSPPSKAPSSPVEMIIGNIWRQLLKVDSIDVRRSFFELGGDSLLAMQMNSRLMKHFKVDVPLQATFEAPTIAALALRIEQAKREWRQDLAPCLTRAPRPAELPLSYAQQRLWFLDQLSPGNSLYNMPGAVRLRGALNLEAVQRSLNEIVRRHEILRTSFPSRDGKPQQHIAESASLPIHSIDFSAIPAANREEALRREMNRQSEYPFDLSDGPLLRVCLLRASEDEHVLFVVMHHIVSDGWSVDILLREFDALYRAFDAGQPSPLPELSIQYADYAVWQREWLRGEVIELQMKYWRQRLAGAATLQLPADFPREQRTDRPSGSFSFQLPPRLYSELKQKCLEEGVTLFMLLLAAFQTLLHRHSGQTDIITGSPAANRNRFETEDLIGYFINPLALRTSFCDNPTCAELLPRVRETVLGAYAHQDVPFDLIVDDLAPARDLTRLPLFQTWFVLHNLLRHGNQPLSSLSATLMPVQTSGARLDLAFEMIEDDQLRGVFVYAADLFRPETIARMAEHFEIILQSVASNSDVCVLDISLEPQRQDGAHVETRRADARADFRF